ncbi:hypothetical protein GW12_10120 [Acinetobacter sp. HR7]|nr:hypothetical protein GW12_10120 [Acinetobacter sp. HR7]
MIHKIRDILSVALGFTLKKQNAYSYLLNSLRSSSNDLL